jgi:hypothetical protein
MATEDTEFLADDQNFRSMMFGFGAVMCFHVLVLMHLLRTRAMLTQENVDVNTRK